MAGKQSHSLVALYASIRARMLRPGNDLATTRDIVESLHMASTEPEAALRVRPTLARSSAPLPLMSRS